MPTIAFYIRNISAFNNYIKPYTDILTKKGYNIILLHISYLTPELNKEKHSSLPKEIIEIDISKYKIKKIINVLLNNNTKAIILINHISIIDVLMTRIANYIKANSIFMEHGIIIGEKKYIKPANKYLSLKRLIIFLKIYLSFSFFSKNIFKEINVLYKTQYKKYYKKIFNYYLLYSQYSIDNLTNTFDFNNNVYLSGYPLFNKEIIDSSIIDNNKILYIHQPHIFHNISNINQEEEYSYLNKISKICEENNYKLYIKLHPIAKKSEYIKKLNNVNFVDTDLVENIKNSKIILGHFSTALFYAIRFKKPVILIGKEFFKQEYKHFFNIFEEISFTAYNDKKLIEILSNKTDIKIDIVKYNNFQDYYIGSNNTYYHRVNTLIKIINNEKN